MVHKQLHVARNIRACYFMPQTSYEPYWRNNLRPLK